MKKDKRNKPGKKKQPKKAERIYKKHEKIRKEANMVEPVTTIAGIAAAAATILLSVKTGFETYLQIMTTLKQLMGEAEIPGWDNLEQTGLEITFELDAMIERLKAIPQIPA